MPANFVSGSDHVNTMIDGSERVLTTGMDAAELPDGAWLFEDVPIGDWAFELIIGDASDIPQMLLLGDVYLTNTSWVVPVEPNQRTTVQVLISLGEFERATASFIFVDCPSGFTEGYGPYDCYLVENPPQLLIQNLGLEPVTLSTYWDAVSVDIGTYQFDGLDSGTYTYWVEYGEVWTPQRTHFVGDTYSDGYFWYVDLQPGAYTVIYVALQGVGDDVNNPVIPDESVIPAPGSYGYALIVQTECRPTQHDANCAPAEVPWEVYLTNVNTYEVYSLSVEGVFMGNGTWMLIVPAGVYAVEVLDAGWYVEYSATIEVIPETDTYLYIEGYAP